MPEGEVTAVDDAVAGHAQAQAQATGPPDARVLTLIGRAATGVVIVPLGVDRQVGLRRAPFDRATSSSSAAERGA